MRDAWPNRPKHHTVYWVLSCSFGAVYLLLSLFMVYSLSLTWRKYKLITRRNTFEAWDQTYCLFSKVLVLIVLLGTPVNVCQLVYVSILFSQPYDLSDADPGYGYFHLSVALNKNLLTAYYSLCDLVCFVQGYEWLVMIILIGVEANKTIHEIRHLNFMRDCRRVRAKEIWYKRFFYLLFTFASVYSAVVLYETLSLVSRPTADQERFLTYYYEAYQIVLYVFETCTFFGVYLLLNKRHNYEFQRNKNSMRLQYLLAFTYHLGAMCLRAPNDIRAYLGHWTEAILIFLSPMLFFLKFLALIRVKSHIDIL